MATSLYPAFTGPQQPNPNAVDPTEGLQALMAGQYQPPAPQTTDLYGGGPGGSGGPSVPSGSMRNSAIAGVLRNKYGLGADVGDISQEDLQSLDTFMRSGALSDKVTAESVAPTIAGQYKMQEAQLKDTGETGREKMKGESAANVANIQNAGKVEQAQAKAGATQFGTGDTGPDAVNYWAQAAMKDSNLLTKLPTAMKQAVAMKMAESGGNVQTMSNQTRQMSESANDLLPMIDKVQNSARSLQSQGLFDVVNSPVRQFLVNHGASSMLGYGGNAQAETGQFQTDLGLLQSGVARAHAGARGAGNSAIAARFEKMMNAGGDLPTFLSEMNGVRDVLSIYAQHTNPNAMSGGASDPYSDPNYTPR
jgi:hypothetical protein